MAKYVNVSSSITVLLDKNSKQNNGTVESITLSNTNSSASRSVDLYLDSASSNNDYYIIKNVVIPVGASLMLDEGVKFDIKKYSLKIKCNPASDLSIIIK